MTATRSRMSIVTRTVLLTSSVAVIAVLVAVVVSYLLINASTLQQSRTRLSGLADLTAAALDRGAIGAGRESLLPQQLMRTLISEQVDAFLVIPGGLTPPGVTAAQVDAMITGSQLSAEASTPNGPVLIEGRGLINGSGLVLELPITVVGGSAKGLLVRFSIALLLGLIIAIPFGFVAAKRLTRPLWAARQAALRMAAGSRDVRLVEEGPSEIADISEALNILNTALASSEGRQRQFLLSVSHELRTPLTAVKGYSEALADGVVSPDDTARTGAILTAEAARLDRLVTDLLDLARLGAVDFRMSPIETDLAELVREAGVVWADRCAREEVSFRCEVPEESLTSRVDPIRVRQIIDNLAENALRVSPTGSTIVLRVLAENGVAVVEVLDSGPGLTAEDETVAFEPGVLFERYRGVRPVGTGLGLAIVGKLAAGLGGSASVGVSGDSSYGQDPTVSGACFRVRLPLAGLEE